MRLTDPRREKLRRGPFQVQQGFSFERWQVAVKWHLRGVLCPFHPILGKQDMNDRLEASEWKGKASCVDTGRTIRAPSHTEQNPVH